MLHVSEDTFYADLLQFDQPMPQLRVMQALEQDILVLLRSARMASAGDSADTLGADAGDLLLAVEMDFYKYLPVYTSDPSYQDGDHREASLRHLFKCRRMDHLRRQTRQQQYIGYHLEDPLGDEDGSTRGSLLADPALSNPADLLEHRQPLTPEDLVWQVLACYCAVNTAPQNLIAFLYKTFCSSHSSTTVREDKTSRSGAVKKTAADLNGRTCADALEYTRQCIGAALNKDVPRECMAALYRRVEGPLGDEILDLTPRAITERGSWIAGRTQADIERLTGRTKK